MHFRVIGHPTTAGITRRLREAFPHDQAPRHRILDRDAKYGNEVNTAIRPMDLQRLPACFASYSLAAADFTTATVGVP